MRDWEALHRRRMALTGGAGGERDDWDQPEGMRNAGGLGNWRQSCFSVPQIASLIAFRSLESGGGCIVGFFVAGVEGMSD